MHRLDVVFGKRKQNNIVLKPIGYYFRVRRDTEQCQNTTQHGFPAGESSVLMLKTYLESPYLYIRTGLHELR